MRTPVKPTPGKVVVVPAIPECNFCADGTPGPYDFRTQAGPWANGCERHWEANRADPELGVGLGQLWVTEEQVLADELVEAEIALAAASAAEAAEAGGRVLLAQNAVFARLDFDLNETEQGLTQKASDALDAFVDEHATRRPPETDIRVQPEGTISVLYGESAEGRDWLAENLAGDVTRWGPHGYVVEHRYVDPILEGAAEDGLAVGVEPDSDVPIVASARLPRRES